MQCTWNQGELDELPKDRKYGIFIPISAVNIHMKRKINKMEFTNSRFTTVPFLFNIQEFYLCFFFSSTMTNTDKIIMHASN